jgi:hypothetical protein
MADANNGPPAIGSNGGPRDVDRALLAKDEELAALLHHDDSVVLLALLKNPNLAPSDLCVLLSRRSLSLELLEEICKRREWLKVYAVKKALVCHPHTPRLVSLRLLRDLYLMDLVHIALLPGVSAELKRNAEDQLAARLPHLPLGQQITLGRRGPARVAGLLLAQGHPQVLAVALDNTHLTMAQILKTLATEGVPESAVQAIAHHRRWSREYTVRLALVRHPASTLSTVLGYLPELTVSDLQELAAPGIVPERLRKYLEAEVHRRIRAGKKLSTTAESSDDSHTSKDL